MAAEHSSTPVRSENPVVINRIIAESRGKPGELLTVLEALQHRNDYNYLSQDVLLQVAEGLGLPASQVFSVATFYAFFNLEPQGKHTLCVCRGTACHTRGSRALLEDMKSALGVEDEDAKGKSFVTTKDREFTIRTVACFGQCALAPVVEIDHKSKATSTVRPAYDHCSDQQEGRTHMRLSVQQALHSVRDQGLKKLFPGKPRIGVGLGTCGVGNGAREVFHAIADRLNNKGVEADICTSGCFGACASEPLVSVAVPGKPLVFLHTVKPEDAEEIAEALAYARVPERKALCRIEKWDHLTGESTFGTGLSRRAQLG